MAAAGQEQMIDISKEAVLGLVEVLKKYFKYRGFRDQILDLARRERPDAVVLIDFSGFNLRISPALRRDLPGARLIYYISPQVWASRASRVKSIQRDFDLLLSILPFEKDWYAKAAPDFAWSGWAIRRLIASANWSSLNQAPISWHCCRAAAAPRWRSICLCCGRLRSLWAASSRA
jgi:lipid A disaccharide synthetase